MAAMGRVRVRDKHEKRVFHTLGATKDIQFRMAFSTPWFTIEESVVDKPGELPYYRLNAPDAVICLPFTPTGDVVMVRQFRPCLGRQTLEVPAGAIEPGETPEQAAGREILEETGHAAGPPVRLGGGRLQMNRMANQEHLLLAFDARPQPDVAAEAGVEPVVMSRAELRRQLCDGQIEQIVAFSFLGFAAAKFGVDLLADPIDRIKQAVLSTERKAHGGS